MTDDGTSTTYPPMTLEEYGKRFIAEGKRLQVFGLILSAPTKALPEILQTLKGIYEFHQN